MYLDVFDRNPYGTDCWLLAADGTDQAVVVDPGFEPEAVHALLDAAGKTPAAVLLTHAHLDHAGTAGVFAGDGIPVFCHPADALAFTDPVAWRRDGFPNPLEPV
jgi:hydroxyacylglutathione hydrolase